MQIGIMLRHYTQHGGGVWVYTHNLLRELLALRTPHEFVLFYRDPKLVETYANKAGVCEIALKAPSTFLWDQLAMWRAEKREQLDLLFNPKYTLPLLAACRTVFVCHGLDWYVMPWGSQWCDRLSHRYLIPHYAHKADAIIAVSRSTPQHVIDYLGVPESLVYPVYLGVDEAFRQPVLQEYLADIRRTFQLPKRFFLYCGQIYPPKNFGRLLQAYARVGPPQGIALVVAGEHRWRCREEIALIDQLGLASWVLWPGWIARNRLPALYVLAEALVLPSLYESFGLPLLEAMSSGCPVVTANRYGPRELVGNAGILVDPEDVESIAHGMCRVVTDRALRQWLVEGGRERARSFSWKTCAKETLQVLESVMAWPSKGRQKSQARLNYPPRACLASRGAQQTSLSSLKDAVRWPGRWKMARRRRV
jgi:glycosyltransferase involved in cell wall biosynthesis